MDFVHFFMFVDQKKKKKNQIKKTFHFQLQFIANRLIVCITSDSFSFSFPSSWNSFSPSLSVFLFRFISTYVHFGLFTNRNALIRNGSNQILYKYICVHRGYVGYNVRWTHSSFNKMFTSLNKSTHYSINAVGMQDFFLQFHNDFILNLYDITAKSINRDFDRNDTWMIFKYTRRFFFAV